MLAAFLDQWDIWNPLYRRVFWFLPELRGRNNYSLWGIMIMGTYEFGDVSVELCTPQLFTFVLRTQEKT